MLGGECLALIQCSLARAVAQHRCVFDVDLLIDVQLLSWHLNPQSWDQTRLLLSHAGQHKIEGGGGREGGDSRRPRARLQGAHTLTVGSIFSAASNDALSPLSAGAGASACVARVPMNAPPAAAQHY